MFRLRKGRGDTFETYTRFLAPKRYLCGMKVNRAVFVKSSPELAQCPPPSMPEYAFIGRSNVGKSSLINMLVNQKGLAKTSGKPGKTQLINHFLVDDTWFLVDLPGYGYAKVSKSQRDTFQRMINGYLLKRENLICTFVLFDVRVPPQQIDMDFIGFLGEKGLPFYILLTKSDKISQTKLSESVAAYENKIAEVWVEMPPMFVTSSPEQIGKKEILNLIGEWNDSFNNEKK